MTDNPIHIPEDLKNVIRVFKKNSKQCWLVGGALRDAFLGRETDDFDLATDALPEEVVKMFHRTFPTGMRHGTVSILLGTHQFETTTLRRDGRYSDGRRPDEVSYSQNILEDLARRDFTINAIAWDLINHRLLDPHNGREDLKKHLIRAIGTPSERFHEDALRAIRACRFASQLNFQIHQTTMNAIDAALSWVPSLSAERIWEELKKILCSPQPSIAFNLFNESGLLAILLPELEACVGIRQKNSDARDVFQHMLSVCDMADSGNFAVRAAALLHDIAAPLFQGVDADEEASIHQHAARGADISDGILRKYRASNAVRERITRLVRQHKFSYSSEWTDATIRRFMARAGLDIVDDLLALRRADVLANADWLPDDAENQLAELEDRIRGILAVQGVFTVGDLALDGYSLMNELQLKPGPLIGRLLRHLLDCALDNPKHNEKARLLELSRSWLETRESTHPKTEFSDRRIS